MTRILGFILMVLAGQVSAAAPSGQPASATQGACGSLLKHTLPGLLEDAIPLCRYQGKVLLVVNTASQCGYTSQYQGLEALWKRYRDRGLVIVGFPSNDFGRQEPGSNKDIAQFCEANFGVSFPMFAKTEVAGPRANGFYNDLAKVSGKRPQWNFHKYLVDRRGERVLSFESAVEPGDRKLVAELERLLDAR